MKISKKATTIAIVNQKGGTGKTTTCENLGIGLAMEGKKVLLVDADPQGSLTISMGWQQPDELPTTLSTLMAKAMNDQSIPPGEGILHHAEGIDLIPANIELAGLEVSLVNCMNREKMLKQVLEGAKHEYDFILLDCTPSLGMLTVNALAAADTTLIPVQAQYLSAKGLEQLLQTVQKVRRQINPKLKIEGILLTMTDSRTNYGQQIDNLIRGAYGSKIKVFDQTIPRSVRAAEISAVGKSIFQHDPNNPFIHVNPPYQLMVIHSSKLVYPRELYQRGVERKRVELIAAHFNEYVANEPKVSFRNGQFIVTDGQHTIEGRILRNGGKDLPILCKVYTGMTVEQEALLFAEQNGFSAPLTAGIKLRAKVVGGDAISKAFLAATNRVGLSLNYDSQQLTDYRIGCVGTAFRLYKQMGEPLYCETMRLIVAAWEGKPDSFRASVLKGMMHFVELYHGEFSEERLLRALRNIHPVDIYRIGQDDPAKLRGWKKYVFPIYTAYNGKCRKDALPMKF